MSTGVFAYAAFVIDAFAGKIVGWECSTSKVTAFVERAIRHAADTASGRAPVAGQHDSPLRCRVARHVGALLGKNLALQGIRPSIGTVGDAYDNALAETTIGLYKTECVRAGSPFRTGPFARLSDIEDATSAWVHWYNNDRIMHRR